MQQSKERQDAVLSALRSRAAAEELAPQIKDIAEETGLPHSAVRSAIMRLAKAGRLEIIRFGTFWQYRLLKEGIETYSPIDSLMDIIYKAGAIFDVPAHQIIGPERTAHIVRPRQAYFYVASVKGFSAAIIARASGRDHTTVLHGRDSATIKMLYDNEFKQCVEDLQRAYDGRIQWRVFTPIMGNKGK